MNEQYLVMKYDAAKREVEFHRYRNGKEEQIRSNSKLYRYMHLRRGDFVLQNMGNTFLGDIAAAFDGLRRIEIRAIMSRADYDDFCAMVSKYNEEANCLIETSLMEELTEESQSTADQVSSNAAQEVQSWQSHVPAGLQQVVNDAWNRHMLHAGDPLPGDVGTLMKMFRENEQNDINEMRAIVEEDVESYFQKGLFGKKLVLSKNNKNRLVILFAGRLAGKYLACKTESLEKAQDAFLQKIKDGVAQNAEIGEETRQAVLGCTAPPVAVQKIEFGFPTIDENNVAAYIKGLERRSTGYKMDYADRKSFVEAALPEYIQAIRRLQDKVEVDYLEEHNRILQAVRDKVLSCVVQTSR